MSIKRGIGFGAVLALVSGLLVAGVGSTSAVAADLIAGDPLAGNGVGTRTVMTTASINSTANPGGVVESAAAFGVPQYAAPPSNSFEGTLRLNNVNANTTGSAKVYNAPGGYDYFGAAGEWYKYLPYSGNSGSNYYLEQQFVQNGSHLIPVTRGLQYLPSLNHNIIWGAGRAWDEAGDKQGATQWTRASIPFTLVLKEENCSFYGLMTFVFNGSQISRVRYQVSSETCAYYKGNMWGSLSSTYSKQSVAGAEAIRQAYAAEVASRMPTKPISELATDYPAAGIDVSAFTQGITPSSITNYGFTYKGVNYVSDCVTRTNSTETNMAGRHPFCDQVIAPSYSTAKSVFLGTALMRLGQKYGTGVYNELVKNWVPEVAAKAAQDPSWNTVTFNQLLDMATGHYTSDGYEVDEAGSTMTSFFAYGNSTRAAKMNQATSFPAKVEPGTKWVYHSSDSFLMSAAMDAYLKSKEGPSADIWNMTYNEVLKPIGVTPDSQNSLRTTDTSKTPWGGYGLFWSREGMARIGSFYAGGDGSHGGVQLLEPSMVDDTLWRNSADLGLPTADQPFLYNNSFWARELTSADSAAYTDPFYVPFMSGYGGITIALMPNCSSFYMVNDKSEYSWSGVVQESNKLDSMGDPSCS